jgi:hypothetical protein
VGGIAFDHPYSAGSFDIQITLEGPDPLIGFELNDSSSATITAAVPEPSTWAMVLVGLVGLGFAGYRSKKNLHTQRIA